MEHYDDDECPITLESLASLPYPAFALTSASSNNTKHYFDGAALATYIISQGTFTNPLTREPLNYEDCVRLDEYLDEYCTGSELYPHRISVREAWSLRESIKVNVAGGDAHQRQREEVLRNEASVALRGLFVFGHERRRGLINNSSSNESAESQTIPRAAGGFNLNHIQPDSHAWGFGSTSIQEGLRIIDDDELAYEAADDAAWREVQEAFPLLNGDDAPLPTTPCAQIDTPSQILSIARQTAELTINEERAKKEEEIKQRQRYFLEALERKRQRIEARRKAKKDAENVLISNQKATAVKQSAREEIDRWLNQKWNEWESESDALISELEAKQKVDAVSTAAEEPGNTNCNQEISCTKEEISVPSAEEKATKMAAKKKAKRQKAKERVKEKKRIERIELEKKERAISLQRERESSNIKCGACGDGILGVGFDKFGKKFCSTKCARARKFCTYKKIHKYVKSCKAVTS